MTQVNGINGGIGSMTAADLKAYIQEAVEDAVEELVGSYDVDVETVSDDEAEFVPAETAEVSEGPSDSSGFMSSISTMFQTLVLGFLSLVGLGTLAAQQNQGTEEAAPAQEADEAPDASGGNDKYTMTEDEKAYLTLHPDFLKDKLAEERYEEQYGSSWVPARTKTKRMEYIKSNITDAELQAYLQLNPNVIKDAIAAER